jgi:sugar phosphate isomerase/epimerase
MGGIPLGDGVVGIPTIVKTLKQSGFDGATTLEIFGVDNVKTSAQRLAQWWAS